MYSHPYVKIMKTDDSSFVIEIEEKYKTKPKNKNDIPTVKYETRHYVAKNLNELITKLKTLIPKLRSANEEYEEAFSEAVAEG